jgi:hypothetical protein
MNQVAFILLYEDKCVQTMYELLIAMAFELFVKGCSGRVISILESADDSIGERSDASNVGDSIC